MNRGQFLASVCMLFYAVSFGAAFAAESAADWTRALYQREIGRHLAGESVSQEEFLSPFTPRTQEAWLAARKGPGPAMDGPILHPYFGWGVLPRQPVALLGVETQQDDGSFARIKIDLRIKGLARWAIVEIRKISGDWRIDDIAYDQGQSFREYLLKCAGAGC
jgi:hypothetical protein